MVKMNVKQEMKNKGFEPVGKPAQLNDIVVTEVSYPSEQVLSKELSNKAVVGIFNKEFSDDWTIYRKAK